MACLFSLGLHRSRFRTSPEFQDGLSFNIMLGGVTCTFKKEIKPYQSYEIWTRVLSWDRKWLYIVCHIVEKGAVKPKGYTLQPWKTSAERKEEDLSALAATDAIHPAILAVSVAKYVFKKGRRTMPPDEALRSCELLPPKPVQSAESPKPASRSDTPEFGMTAPENILVEAVPKVVSGKAAFEPPLDPDPIQWNWDSVEAERLRGLEIAEHMAGLDKALEVFKGEDEQALGEY